MAKDTQGPERNKQETNQIGQGRKNKKQEYKARTKNNNDNNERGQKEKKRLEQDRPD